MVHTEDAVSCHYTLYIWCDNRVYNGLGISHDTGTFGGFHRHDCCILLLGGLPANRMRRRVCLIRRSRIL